MNLHRYHFMYQPLARFVRQLSTRGQLFLGAGKLLLLITLVALTLLRCNLL